MSRERDWEKEVVYKPIGVIQTPYRQWAPNQPVEQEKGIGDFRIVVKPEYAEGLRDLDRCNYVTLIYHLNQVSQTPENAVTPPWSKGKTVGLFASRSPVRPNAIGLSVVRLVRIEGNELVTWPIDVFDGTPLLDIKPYFKTLDAKEDANDGWIDELEGKAHLLEHVRGIPHDHSHDHDHDHTHVHEHSHDHGEGEKHSHPHEHSHKHPHEHHHTHDQGDDHSHGHAHDHEDDQSHEHDHENLHGSSHNAEPHSHRHPKGTEGKD